MSEAFSCPLCGAATMARVVEGCTLSDGFVVKKLGHLKCGSCGERFFDDEAMRRIQEERGKRGVKVAV